MSEKPRRRTFPTAEKWRILDDADQCRQPGEIGALLRREGIYASQLATWRRLRDDARREALAPRKRGPKPTRNPATEEIRRLERENARLRQKLESARFLIDFQKKISAMLGIAQPGAEELEKQLAESEDKNL